MQQHEPRLAQVVLGCLGSRLGGFWKARVARLDHNRRACSDLNGYRHVGPS